MTELTVYALLERRRGHGSARPPQRLGLGIARRPLAAVAAGPAWVVVEEAAPRAPTVRALVAHDRIVRRLTRASEAVLPLRFGASVADHAALRALTKPLAALLRRAFSRVRGCVQFTLRVRGVRAPARRHTARAGAGPGTRWLEEQVARHRVPEIAALTEATRPFVREVRMERRDVPPLLATVYCLVARDDVAPWRSAVARSRRALDVDVTVTGPWPPYAFAELE
jgi:hypothetical protein